MKCVFDLSSILKAVIENRIEVLAEGYTIDLARYKVSSLLWKEQNLTRK